MSEFSPSQRLVHFGLQPQHTEGTIGTFNNVIEANPATQGIPASLNEKERSLLQNATVETNRYLVQKFERLNISSTISFPQISYRSKSNDESKGGFYNPNSGLVVVNIPPENRDFLATALTQAHEISHATAVQQLRIQWKKDDSGKIKERTTTVVGLTRSSDVEKLAHPKNDVYPNSTIRLITDEKKLSRRFMDGLENGLAVMDSVDVYTQVLKDVFPEEAMDHEVQATKGNIESLLRRSDNTPFGPIDRKVIPAFLEIQTHKIPFLRKVIQSARLNDQQLRNFIFITEVCRTLGHQVLTDTNELDFTNEQMIQTGRNILERDRYTGSTSGLKKLVKVFGLEKSKALFKADDREEGLYEAMAAVRARQRELGLPTSL